MVKSLHIPGKIMEKSAEQGKVALWGVGDRGIRVVFAISEEIRRLVRPVAVDSDLQSLICSPIAQKIRIGSPTASGRSAGGDEEKGDQAFRESEAKIRENLSSIRTLIIVGGLGGGVASTIIPNICRCARRLKIFTLVLATRPFSFEGKKRNRVYREARERIEKSGAGLACFNLDRLIGKVEDDTPHQEVFERCDRILQDAAECLIAYLSAPPGQGGDAAALENFFSGAGEAVLGAEEAPGPENLVRAAKAALSSLSLTPAELARVRGVLLQIDGGAAIPFRSAQTAIGSISRMLGEDCEMLYIVTRYRTLEEGLSVRLLAAGVPDRPPGSDASPITVALTADKPPPRQELIDFNKFTRGIFADTDPSRSEGEDLDIPTFARKGIQLDEEPSGNP